MNSTYDDLCRRVIRFLNQEDEKKNERIHDLWIRVILKVQIEVSVKDKCVITKKVFPRIFNFFMGDR